ncbi:phasin family protein [Roseococcus sp. DSY-14]|uniref:phasin family protein n=1 Tax=Roseococcus sp. DSY-14 TaxID=3369650 RepID=UPI00387B714B
MDEMMKGFGQMRMPDMSAFAEAQKRNLEALAQANRVALEGAQAIAKRNMEILQQSVAEMTEVAQKMASPEASPQAKAAQQAEVMKAAYEKAVANMKEIADLIQKSNGEAVGVLNRRFAEAMEEVKGMMKG